MLFVMAMPDIDKYRRHVDHFDLTEDQKVDLIQSVWRVVEGFADQAFGIDPVQLVGRASDKDAGARSVVLEFEKTSRTDNTPLTDTFRLAGRSDERMKKKQ